jgi:uncharacterized membrane protein
MKEVFRKYLDDEIKFDKKIMFGIICLIIVISGLFGWVYEFIFYYFNSGMKEFYYRGGNFLPWINIYAYGALIVFYLTRNMKKNPIKIFIISVIASGVLELVSGYVMYTFFDGFRCWNYNTEILNFGNIGGFVCLRSVVFFGVSCLLLIYCIIPLCYFLASKLNRKTFLILSITLCSIILLDDIYNLAIARLLNLPRASDIYKSIGFKYMNSK